MAKNLMPEVAEILGVDLCEHFKIKMGGKVLENEYCVDLDGLWDFDDYDPGIDVDMLVELLKGEAEVVKLPWQPKKGYVYWSIDMDWEITEYVWSDDALDYMKKAIGYIFRTQEEAEAAFPEVYKRLTGKEWEE